MPVTHLRYLILSLAMCAILPSQVIADKKPLWEAGLGLTSLYLPNYRGSSESDLLTLPFPYLVYRGEKFRMDRNGLRGNLFNSESLSLEISASASPPVDSEDNPLREGMPDLDPTFEFGPRLKLKLFEYSNSATLSLDMPLRAVLSTDFSDLDYQGWLFHPNINLDIPYAYNDWKLAMQAGPIYGNRQYHDYFYGVNTAFVRPDRPAFETRAGYSGFSVLAATTKRYKRLWVGAFFRYDNLSGADITDSPLVDDNDTFMAGMAFAWVFKTSATMVDVEE